MHARQSLFRHEKTSTDDGPARHPGRPIRDPIWSPREREGARELTNPPAGTVAITTASLELELDGLDHAAAAGGAIRSDPAKPKDRAGVGRAAATRPGTGARVPGRSFLGNWLSQSGFSVHGALGNAQRP